MSNKPLISNYADAAALFARARKPEQGKPIGRLFRLMREKNGYGDIYHLYWGTPHKLMAIIHPNDTVEVYIPKRVPWYVFAETLPKVVPIVVIYSRKKDASVVRHVEDLSYLQHHEGFIHYPGIRFNMLTGQCVSTKPPPPVANPAKREEWLHDLRVFKKQFELRAKLGVIDGLINRHKESGIPDWVSRTRWDDPEVVSLVHSCIKTGVPSTEMLQLVVKDTFHRTHHLDPVNTDRVRYIFNYVLNTTSLDLRKLYGVFDETEAA